VDIDVSAEVLLEPMDVPLLVEPAVIGALPVDGAAAAGAAALPPVGVPVVPIGVCCELCWPAPTGALLTAGLGGLPWATAVPANAMAATPASRIWMDLDAIMVGLLGE
jgi:hypothetical protein